MSMIDRILIDQLSVEARIGAFDWEKQIRQQILVSLELHADLQPAADTDRLDQAIDYAEVCDRVRQLVVANHYDLLECLALTLLRALFAGHSALERIVIRIDKPGAVAGALSVAVRMDRTREEMDPIGSGCS
jgi:dihydroneopterin aldolase